MSSVHFHIRRNGGFSFLLPLLIYSLLLFAPLLLPGQKKNSDISSLLQIRTTGKNVKDGVIREIKAVHFDPSGITRYKASSPPPPEKKVRKSRQHILKRYTKAASGTLAALWQEKAKGETIRWKPRIMSGKGLAVADSVLSPDRSLLIFMETQGTAPGPYGTRLIFLDTHSWQIVFARDYEEFHAQKGVFLEDKLLLYCKGQASRDTKDSFILIDPVSGEIVYNVTVPFPAGKLAAGNNLLAVSEKEKPIVRLYALSNGELILKKEWKCASSDPALLFTPDGKKLLAAGKDFREELLLSNMRSWQRNNIKLPFAPAKIFMPGHGLYLFLPGTDSTGKEAQLLRNDVVTPIGSVSGGLALPGLGKDSFFLLLARKGTFADHLLPSCERKRAISSVDVRPRTPGSVLFAATIPHAGSIAVMDSNGLFYLLFPDYSGKRFQKLILIQ